MASNLIEPFRLRLAEFQQLAASLRAKASLQRDLDAVRAQAVALAPRVVALRIEFEDAAETAKLTANGRVADVRRSLIRLREELDDLLATTAPRRR